MDTHTINVAGSDFRGSHSAFVFRIDALGRIGEPHRAVRLDHHVVGRVRPLALVVGGQDGAAAVNLGARDAAGEVLAADQPPFPIDSMTVGAIGGVLEDRN
jgi:hypothetical protein